jgi:GNAT superfamily N-acetyltransferase
MPWPCVRLLEARQIDSAVALFNAQLKEHGITTPADDLRSAVENVVADPRYGFVVLASTIEAGPIGIAYASCLLSLEHGGISGWLEELYVLPQWRGCGIGSHLVAEVIRHAKKLGWRAIDLEVIAGHERAISLYLRHKFQLLSRTRLFRTIYSETDDGTA